MKEIAKTEYYEIRVDESKNRIHLTIIGFWKDRTKLRDYLPDLRRAVEEVAPGFTVLADLTKMKTPMPEIGELHEEAQRVVSQAGLSRTAEIVSGIVERMAAERYSKSSGMNKRSFADLAEAENWLDGSPDGLRRDVETG